MSKFEQIFMGSPTAPLQCYQMHRDLEVAFKIIGWMQQPPRSESEEQARYNQMEYEDQQIELEKIAREIYERLTGNEISDA